MSRRGRKTSKRLTFTVDHVPCADYFSGFCHRCLAHDISSYDLSVTGAQKAGVQPTYSL
uniref:Uncharacterized protein n=1 Tax=Faecalibaculum rodentium TaxID=1702221 RepID=A0A140DSI7_9FIRM|nr:hypothetical protein AALO17_04800 [Faecalibaculum rodentium]